MRWLSLLFALLLSSSAVAMPPAGGQYLAYNSGYSFRDVVGYNFANNYSWHVGSQVVAPSNAVFMGTATPSRFPNSSVRWTLLSTDNPLGDGSNRDEFYAMLNGSSIDENASSGTVYYGISIYLPDTWVDPTIAAFPYFLAFQLHQPNASSAPAPAFALDLSFVPGHYTLRQLGGDDSSPVSHQVDLGTHVYDQWVDFLFEVTWAIDNTGYTAVWTRTNKTGALKQVQIGTGTPITPWNTPTLSSSGGIAWNHYWKHGAYRSLGESTTAVYYSGPVSRATTMQDAASAAFNQWP